VLGPLYWLISKILLLWHGLFDAIGMTGEFLSTNWDWVLAIVFMVITIRAILFPIFVKQIKSQRAMQALAPQLTALKEKHKGDREGLQRATMELYKKENANPLMGCLPMVIQIPVMWSLFHVLRHLKITTTDPETKQLYGWTIGQFDDAVKAKFLGAPITAAFKSSAADVAAQHSTQTNVRIVAAILVVIMIATTYLTSRQMILKTGWSEDPTQKMVQRLMLYGIPVTLLFSGFSFPIGVVLYWTTTNLFSLGQQYWVLRKYPPPGKVTSAVPPIGGAPKPATAKAVTGGKQSGKAATAGKTAGSGKAGAGQAGKQQPAKPATRFGRKPATPPPAPAREVNKALAPKPGAKPVNPKRGAAKATPTTPPPGEISEAEAAASDTGGPNTGQNGSRAKSTAKRNSG
jgi:YidC/Oxa1 family membrane protein insertase